MACLAPKFFRVFPGWLAPVCAMALLSSCQPGSPESDKTILFGSAGPAIPHIHVYHGLILDGRFKILKANPENVRTLLQAFSAAMSTGLPPDAKAELERLSPKVAGIAKTSSAESILARLALADWLFRRTSPQMRSQFGSRYWAVRDWAMPMASGERMSGLRNKLGSIGLRLADAPPVDDGYVAQCRDAGVPIPKDWGSEEWKFQGVVPGKYVFAGEQGQITQVYAYSDSNVPGACIALPRRSATTGDIEALGIICQGSVSGKACFWDNIDAVSGQRLTGKANEAFRLGDVQNANVLRDNCTDCHRGGNVFVIHPGTPLELKAPFSTSAKRRYTPVSTQTTWANPPALVEEETAPCASCHEIPSFGAEGGKWPDHGSPYCGILEKASRATMPPLSEPSGWETPSKKYAPHIDAFRAACTGS